MSARVIPIDRAARLEATRWCFVCGDEVCMRCPCVIVHKPSGRAFPLCHACDGTREAEVAIRAATMTPPEHVLTGCAS